MPRRTDISSVLVIGSGPIVIGQACEFDYSGTQACRVLRDEGLRVILVNSNPATIMTDPEFADATYIEPITPEVVEKIIAQGAPGRAARRPSAGRPRSTPRSRCTSAACWSKYGVELIGADVEAIQRGEDRQRVQGDRASDRRRVRAQPSICHTMDECLARGRGPRLPGRGPAVVHDGRRRLRASPTTRPTCAGSPARACTPARPPRCCSRSRSSAGRSTSSS